MNKILRIFNDVPMLENQALVGVLEEVGDLAVGQVAVVGHDWGLVGLVGDLVDER